MKSPSAFPVASSGKRIPLYLGTAILLIAAAYACWIMATPTVKTSLIENTNSVTLPAKRDRTVAPHPVQPASPLPAPRTPAIPSGASDTQKAFLSERARLNADRMKMEAQLIQATPEERHQAMQKWHEENAEALAAQQQLAQQMAAETPPPELRVPPAPQIPENATPEMREFLTARHAAMKDDMEMMNQIRDIPPEERQQAMHAWHEKSSGHREAMQAAAIKLSQSQTPSQNR